MAAYRLGAVALLTRRPLAVLACATLWVGCAGLSVHRTTPEAGTFSSKAWSLTILGFDLPESALLVARGNASDSALPNLQVRREVLRPYLGRLDFLLRVFAIRYARVEGTWGFSTED